MAVTLFLLLLLLPLPFPHPSPSALQLITGLSWDFLVPLDKRVRSLFPLVVELHCGSRRRSDLSDQSTTGLGLPPFLPTDTVFGLFTALVCGTANVQHCTDCWTSGKTVSHVQLALESRRNHIIVANAGLCLRFFNVKT